MLLNDIGKSPDATFKKINQHLESNYGFKISEDVSDKDLVMIMEQIEEEITELKIKGDDAKASPEISKRLLVLEGIRNLREFAMMQFQSPKLNAVIKNLTDYVVDAFEISGMQQTDLDEALNRAMDEYRSSRYRFPDEVIRQRVLQGAMQRIQAANNIPTSEPAMAFPMEEDLGAEENDEALVGEIEEGAFDNQGKRSSATGGYSAEMPDTDRARYAMKVLNNPSLSLAPQDDGEQIPMVRDKNGRMVPDPFAAQAAARRKGIVMKEDDIEEAVRSGMMNPRTGEFERPSNQGERNSVAQGVRHQRAMDRLGGSSRGAQSGNDMSRPGHEDDYKLATHSGKNVGKFKGGATARDGKGIAMKENLVKRLRTLLETEVSQAEVMMAAKGFAQELQEMIEKIGRLQNEDLPPVTDQMRETYGSESSMAFQTQIAGALQNVMDSLYTAKAQVDDAVANMAATGQVDAAVDMDKDLAMGGDPLAEPEIGMDPDLDNIEADLDGADEFGAADGEEPLGRAMKAESVATMKRKISEMKRLVEKARKLREAQAGR